ncbi:hypothetical protein G8B20_05765 [Lactobacillus amylovorus]|uniref:hypothetical protein n=1 Tax=Lactobacillus amylovorus TaxID=1604 RepID=UPI001F599EC9|nr:hypothetical protein [Lactobacillus amylovorus]UNL46197.1 hypothetical protein G8B20_05765 [Lactobacillus amylovorus]
MKKTKEFILVLSLIAAMFLAFVAIDSTTNLTNTVQASSISFPKNMRGHWKSKPTYTWQKKHINKWMAIPAMDMKVTAKKATWHYVGYLLKGMGYNHKKYVLRMSNSNGILKGHGPFGQTNSFEIRGKKLILFYQGGGMITFNKAR